MPPATSLLPYLVCRKTRSARSSKLIRQENLLRVTCASAYPNRFTLAWNVSHDQGYLTPCPEVEGFLHSCQRHIALPWSAPFLLEPNSELIWEQYCFYRKATPYQVHVSAAKAAVDATSAVLAIEQGPHGVRSNVIAPGPIAGTEGMDRLSAKGGENEGWYEKSAPLGRMGDVRDCANAAVFLFSDAASFITGQVLVVDGAFDQLRSTSLPYPQSVLDPESVQKMIKARM